MKTFNKTNNHWNEHVLCGCLYCRFFADYTTYSHSLTMPFRRLWFWFPRFLWRKMGGWLLLRKDENNLAYRLWHGLYIWPIPHEGEIIRWAWWKNIRFNPKYLIK